MTDQKYAAIASKQQSLIRKALDGSVFIAPYSATAVTSITADSSGSPGTPTLAPLPAGYTDLGLMTSDGAQFSNDVSTADITSWGRIEPSRRDITSDVDSIHVVCQETKLATLAAYIDVASSTITADSTTGEVKVNKPSSPTVNYYRMFAIGVDNPGGSDEIYIARFYPRVSLTSRGDQSYNSGDTEMEWDTTWTAFTDSVLNTSLTYFFGGPGWQALLTDMGLGS